MIGTVISASAMCLSNLATSCSPSKDVIKGISINQSTLDSMDDAYLIPQDAPIYYADARTISNHNVLFDLQKFSQDNNDEVDFTISGTINFGILVGLGQSVNIYGTSNNLINVKTQGDFVT
jgi:hypothetical protein